MSYTNEEKLYYIAMDIYKFMKIPFFIRKFVEALYELGEILPAHMFKFYEECYSSVGNQRF